MVDCLLPAQVKGSGSNSPSSGRASRADLESIDCEIRGGEYVAYDRADYRTALAVWMETAKRAIPRRRPTSAKSTRRVWAAPRLRRCGRWYQRAAERGYGPAQINLGQLYEQGLGVPRDQVVALNWYRRATGSIPESDLRGLDRRGGRARQPARTGGDARRRGGPAAPRDRRAAEPAERAKCRRTGRSPPPGPRSRQTVPQSSAAVPARACPRRGWRRSGRRWRRSSARPRANWRRTARWNGPTWPACTRAGGRADGAGSGAAADARAVQHRFGGGACRADARPAGLAHDRLALESDRARAAEAVNQLERERASLTAERRQLAADQQELETRRAQAATQNAVAEVEALLDDLRTRQLELSRRSDALPRGRRGKPPARRASRIVRPRWPSARPRSPTVRRQSWRGRPRSRRQAPKSRRARR